VAKANRLKTIKPPEGGCARYAARWTRSGDHGFDDARNRWVNAAELIGELSGIIGKLELVRSEFGV